MLMPVAFAKKLVLNGAPLLTSPEFSNVSILEGFKGLLNETKPYDLEGSNTIEAAFDGKDSISNVLDSVSESDSSLFTSIMKALNQRTMASVYAKFTMPLIENGFSVSEDKSKAEELFGWILLMGWHMFINKHLLNC